MTPSSSAPSTPSVWASGAQAARPLMEAFALRHGIPGAQVAVAVRGEIVASFAFGQADCEQGREMTPSTLMRVASHSKTFTATAVLQLAEVGALCLDDELQVWLPEVEGAEVAKATLRDLLSHSAGLTRDGMNSDYWSGEFAFPAREDVVRMAREGSVLQRNERFKYTNVGYSLLGYVIEEASGLSYAEYVQERIIAPLGLENTGPEYDAARSGEYAIGYTAPVLGDPSRRRVPIDPVISRGMEAATGFCSTAEDLCRYFSAQLLTTASTLDQYAPSEEGADTAFEQLTCALLSDDSKREAHRRVTGVGPRGYGLGFIIQEVSGKKTFGHSGGYPGFISRTWVVPEEQAVVCVLTNSIDGPANELGGMVFEAAKLAGAEEHPSWKRAQGEASAVRASFEGEFMNLWGRTAVMAVGKNLYVMDPGYPVDAEALPLIYKDADTLIEQDPYGFGSHGEPWRFERREGRPVAVRTGNGGRMVAAGEYELPERIAVSEETGFWEKPAAVAALSENPNP